MAMKTYYATFWVPEIKYRSVMVKVSSFSKEAATEVAKNTIDPRGLIPDMVHVSTELRNLDLDLLYETDGI